jgi:hypothetical protein
VGNLASKEKEHRLACKGLQLALTADFIAGTWIFEGELPDEGRRI